MRVLNYEEFEKEFGPVDDNGSEFYQATSRELLLGSGVNHIWSVYDTGVGELYLLTGVHMVDVVGYLLTEKPWQDPDIEVIYVSEEDYLYRANPDV